ILLDSSATNLMPRCGEGICDLDFLLRTLCRYAAIAFTVWISLLRTLCRAAAKAFHFCTFRQC
ncbi:MAG TPA: hypothetical protein VFF90_00300, partial [Saprospiraceae bacterium]|nr:hypothetical protein [Saprospiraceae bacterium]